MIGARIMLEDGTEIAAVWLNAKPAVGEYLWLTGKSGDEASAAYGTSSFTVLEVAHWTGADWTPNTHVGRPVHSLALYVAPTTRGARG